MKIYTRAGDRGETSLLDGTRVSKADARIEATGELDELNALLGWTRAIGVDEELDRMLDVVQRDLFALGTRLADPKHHLAGKADKLMLGSSNVERLERWIDQVEDSLPPLKRFILPGGSAAAASLQHARTVCRRAERYVVGLGIEGLDPALPAYINRLSDLLFVLARAVNHRSGYLENEW
jgi:cob(I)alamin adenosyltransferase